METRTFDAPEPTDRGPSSTVDAHGAGRLQWVGEPMRQPTPGHMARDVFAVQQIKAVPTLLEVVCDVTGMKFAAVTRFTEQGSTLCAVTDHLHAGIQPGNPLNATATFCFELNQSGAPLVIENVTQDPRFRQRQRVGLLQIQSYVSVPITLPNGRHFGNLCAMDQAPARIAVATMSMLTRFAAHIALQLHSEISREDLELSLRDERASGELRDQFIAILGHDLRNPLQAIFATSDLMTRQTDDPVMAGMAARIKANSRRMSALIDDVLDFARGRLGGGIGLNLIEIENLNAGLTSVVDELQDGQPNRQIDYSFRVDRKVRCDIGRVQQVASNLIGNALMHGATDKAVRVTAVADEHDLVFEVWNDGEPIPSENLAKVFEPFWRRDSAAHREGLGLGLHICSQIVRAHGGQLSVQSTREAGTTFTARIPLHRLA